LPGGIAGRVYISSTSPSRRWLKLATASTPRSGLVTSTTGSASSSSRTSGESRRRAHRPRARVTLSPDRAVCARQRCSRRAHDVRDSACDGV